jgi:biopolymer transport protein ExbB
MSMFSFIIKGGPIMYPIIACSIVALAITIERLIRLRQGSVHPGSLVNKLKMLLMKQRIDEALTICTSADNPIARVIEAGILKRNLGRNEIKEAIEHMGRKESINLQTNLPALAIVANISPLLGLLGTVTGMIKVFNVIAVHGVGDPNILAGGISEALITTAAGLAVAIPTLIAHGYMTKKVHTLVVDMEDTSMELLDILTETEIQPSTPKNEVS